MASDHLVTAKLILRAQAELARKGPGQVLEHLEAIEPDLASYLMEQGSLIDHKLGELGGSPQKTRKLYRQIEGLLLVCLIALRQGHYELWQQENPQDESTSSTPIPPHPKQ